MKNDMNNGHYSNKTIIMIKIIKIVAMVIITMILMTYPFKL